MTDMTGSIAPEESTLLFLSQLALYSNLLFIFSYNVSVFIFNSFRCIRIYNAYHVIWCVLLSTVMERFSSIGERGTHIAIKAYKRRLDSNSFGLKSFLVVTACKSYTYMHK